MDRLEYFAAANSADGFYNMFDGVFADVDRLYIIKGGPGTGKSSFMRKIANRAQDKGCRTELIYCSSDPSSLDGVIFENDGMRFAIADGTAPHLLDSKLPGLRDEIINLGENWNSDKIRAHGRRIEILNKYKGLCWGRAYRLLAAAGQCEMSAESAITPCVNFENLSCIAGKIINLQKNKPCNSRLYRSFFGRAYSMHGDVTLDCFGGSVGEYRPVSNYYGVGRLFLCELVRLAGLEKIPIIELKYPLIPSKTDGVYFCGSRELYRIDGGKSSDGMSRRISIKSAVDPVALRGVRSGVRFALTKCRELTDGALGELERAGEYHAELESIYKNAMDFEKNNMLCESLCEKMNL